MAPHAEPLGEEDAHGYLLEGYAALMADQVARAAELGHGQAVPVAIERGQYTRGGSRVRGMAMNSKLDLFG